MNHPAHPARPTTGPEIDAIATAHMRSVDAAAGFRTMVEKAEPHFRAIARGYLALHEEHVVRLAALLAAYGRQPDPDSSFMSGVDRAVVAVRAFFGDVDEDVLGQVRGGEGRVLKSFDEAIRKGPERDAAALAEMKAELERLIEQSRALER